MNAKFLGYVLFAIIIGLAVRVEASEDVMGCNSIQPQLDQMERVVVRDGATAANKNAIELGRKALAERKPLDVVAYAILASYAQVRANGGSPLEASLHAVGVCRGVNLALAIGSETQPAKQAPSRQPGVTF